MIVTALADAEAGKIPPGKSLPLQVTALATLVGSYEVGPKSHPLAELEECGCCAALDEAPALLSS